MSVNPTTAPRRRDYLWYFAQAPTMIEYARYFNLSIDTVVDALRIPLAGCRVIDSVVVPDFDVRDDDNLVAIHLLVLERAGLHFFHLKGDLISARFFRFSELRIDIDHVLSAASDKKTVNVYVTFTTAEHPAHPHFDYRELKVVFDDPAGTARLERFLKKYYRCLREVAA
jgi:hypothetical protein